MQSAWVCAAIFNALLVSDFAFKGFQNKNNKNQILSQEVTEVEWRFPKC